MTEYWFENRLAISGPPKKLLKIATHLLTDDEEDFNHTWFGNPVSGRVLSFEKIISHGASDAASCMEHWGVIGEPEEVNGFIYFNTLIYRFDSGSYYAQPAIQVFETLKRITKDAYVSWYFHCSELENAGYLDVKRKTEEELRYG